MKLTTKDTTVSFDEETVTIGVTQLEPGVYILNVAKITKPNP